MLGESARRALSQRAQLVHGERLRFQKPGTLPPRADDVATCSCLLELERLRLERTEAVIFSNVVERGS
jgi:hypothetical protein